MWTTNSWANCSSPEKGGIDAVWDKSCSFSQVLPSVVAQALEQLPLPLRGSVICSQGHFIKLHGKSNAITWNSTIVPGIAFRQFAGLLLAAPVILGTWKRVFVCVLSWSSLYVSCKWLLKSNMQCRIFRATAPCFSADSHTMPAGGHTPWALPSAVPSSARVGVENFLLQRKHLCPRICKRNANSLNTQRHQLEALHF